MADIFLSYRRDDSRLLVEELARILERAGWSVWFAPKASVSDDLAIIDYELEMARCVVGLWSARAGASPYVVKEFEIAHGAQKLLAVETDGTKLPDQFLDRIVGRLTNLSRLTYGADLPQLMRGIANKIGLPDGFNDIENLIGKTLDNGFGFFKIGNITIPAQTVFGIPREPFRPQDVSIEFENIKHEERVSYPKILNDHYDELLDKALAKHGLDRKRLRDNTLARLDWWDQEPEGEQDERGLLKLHFSKTSYFRIWATNDSIDEPFVDEPTGQVTTIRNSFCFRPFGELANSLLANNPGVEVVVISDTPDQTPQRQVLIRRRSMRVAGYRGWFQSSASGHMAMSHLNSEGAPSPFVTAVTEAKQEIADGFDLNPEDYQMIGLVLKEQDLHPSFLGYVVTSIPAEELRSAYCRDDFEGDKFVIPFDPDTVLRHISEHRWFPLSAMALISSLEAFYDPREVRVAASRVPLKRAQDFYLSENWGVDNINPFGC